MNPAPAALGRLLALLAAATLGGCGVLDPYSTLPRAAQPGQPPGQRVGICYNSLHTPLTAAQAEAQRECPAGAKAQHVDTDWYLQYCPLLLPAHATFVCTPEK